MSAREQKEAGFNKPVRRALVVLSETYADGGIQRFNRTFLSACDQLNIACDVLSLGDGEDARPRWSEPQSASIAVFSHRKPLFALATAAKVIRGDYDFIIIGHINLLALVIAAAKLGSKARTVLIAHGIEVWSGLSGWRRAALRGVDTFLCVSRYTKDSIRSQAPELPEERFVIFPNALSESWRELPRVDIEPALLKRLPERFLLSVTRLDRAERYKGIVTVLETLPMIDDPAVHYVVAGKGNDLEFIKRVADRFGVRSRVHFVGSVSDAELMALYRRCIAFVLPSGKEGFGIVFLEAMYFGACVIAAAEKGAIDVVQHERTGLLVPYGSAAALKSAIDRVIADPAFRGRTAAAGHATVVGEGPFTFRSYVSRLARALDCDELTQQLDESCV